MSYPGKVVNCVFCGKTLGTCALGEPQVDIACVGCSGGYGYPSYPPALPAYPPGYPPPGLTPEQCEALDRIRGEALDRIRTEPWLRDQLTPEQQEALDQLVSDADAAGPSVTRSLNEDPSWLCLDCDHPFGAHLDYVTAGAVHGCTQCTCAGAVPF